MAQKNNETNSKFRAHSVPMIEMTYIYDTKHHILLYPFSKKHWFLIEKDIIKRNLEVIVLDLAKELYKKRDIDVDNSGKMISLSQLLTGRFGRVHSLFTQGENVRNHWLARLILKDCKVAFSNSTLQSTKP